MTFPLHLEEKDLKKEIQQLDINPEILKVRENFGIQEATPLSIKEIEEEDKNTHLKELETEISIQKEVLKRLNTKLHLILKVCYYWDKDLFSITEKINNRVNGINVENKEIDFKEYLEVI